MTEPRCLPWILAVIFRYLITERKEGKSFLEPHTESEAGVLPQLKQAPSFIWISQKTEAESSFKELIRFSLWIFTVPFPKKLLSDDHLNLVVFTACMNLSLHEACSQSFQAPAQSDLLFMLCPKAFCMLREVQTMLDLQTLLGALMWLCTAQAPCTQMT